MVNNSLVQDVSVSGCFLLMPCENLERIVPTALFSVQDLVLSRVFICHGWLVTTKTATKNVCVNGTGIAPKRRFLPQSTYWMRWQPSRVFGTLVSS